MGGFVNAPNQAVTQAIDEGVVGDPVVSDCPIRGGWAGRMVYENPILPE